MSSSDEPFAGIIKDKVRENLLEEEDVSYTVFPAIPPDKEDFREDVKNAMRKIREKGSFIEETKMKIKELYRRADSEG